MQLAQVIALFFVAATLIGFIIYLATRKRRAPAKRASAPEKKTKKGEKAEVSIFESFDYNGIKILHTDGVYTILEGDGKPKVYPGAQYLPPKYRKMILEIDGHKTGERKGKYYLENVNGKFMVRFPDGRSKKYKRYEDIPERIRKLINLS